MNKEVEKIRPLTRVIMTIGQLPSSYLISMTYEEQLLWLCNFLQKEVIPVVNNNSEAFIELKEYVENYFDNLDIQEEVNNKLEEMAESGELQEIITSYIELKSLLMFNNVNDMKNAQNLANGSYLKTLGYYSKGDLGGATYYVREITNQDVIDNATIFALSNYPELVATLVIETSSITVDSFGAHGNGTTDDTQAIQHSIDFSTTNNLTCLFNNKVYITSEPLILKETTRIMGMYTNDEFYSNSTIKNTTSNMIDIENNTIGVHIKNLRFYSDKTKELYFLSNENYQITTWVIEDCGFQEFYKVFNALTGACRFNRLWINGGKSAGKLSGNDNQFSNSFIGAPLATTEDLLELDGYGLSRLDNIFFTGKTDNDHGNDNIVKIGGYCTNLSFNGCYFDFSNGSGVTILGKGNDFPKSGATNINFNDCLFRGNCCDLVTAKHIINIDYANNVNINNCSFATQTRYAVNANSKIYNLGTYAQGVSITNNYYETDFSYTNSNIYNAEINEGFLGYYNKLGNYRNNNILRTYTNINDETKVWRHRATYTTGGTYGEFTINFPENMGANPIIHVMPIGSNYIAVINNLTSTSAQIIIKHPWDGSAATSVNVDVCVTVSNK